MKELALYIILFVFLMTFGCAIGINWKKKRIQRYSKKLIELGDIFSFAAGCIECANDPFTVCQATKQVKIFKERSKELRGRRYKYWMEQLGLDLDKALKNKKEVLKDSIK